MTSLVKLNNGLLLCVTLAAAILFCPCVLIAQDVEASGKKDYGPYPLPDSGYVTDLAELLSEEEEERIERALWQVEQKTSVEIIVVTITRLSDYPGVKANSIESFAKGLFDTYGIGNLPANDGVLLLVSSGNRKVRIELGAGHGHRRDADAKHIVEHEILPCFRTGDYERGISRGVEAIIRTFAGGRLVRIWELLGYGLLVLVLLLIGVSLYQNGKRGWGWVVVGLSIVLLLWLIKVIFAVLRELPSGHSSGWGSGGSGGFGGGSSGGGGATGSW